MDKDGVKKTVEVEEISNRSPNLYRTRKYVERERDVDIFDGDHGAQQDAASALLQCVCVCVFICPIV